MLSHRIWDILTSGRPLDVTEPLGRLVLFHNAASLFGLVAASIFVPVNFLGGHRMVACMLLPVVGASLFNLWYVRRSGQVRLASTLTAVITFPLFVALVIEGGIETRAPTGSPCCPS